MPTCVKSGAAVWFVALLSDGSWEQMPNRCTFRNTKTSQLGTPCGAGDSAATDYKMNEWQHQRILRPQHSVEMEIPKSILQSRRHELKLFSSPGIFPHRSFMRTVDQSQQTPFRHAVFSVAGRGAVAKSPPCPCVGLTVQDKRGLNLGHCDSVDTSAMAKTNWQPPRSAEAENLTSPASICLSIRYLAISPSCRQPFSIAAGQRASGSRTEASADRRRKTREPRILETQTQHPRPEGPRLSACEESWGKRAD